MTTAIILMWIGFALWFCAGYKVGKNSKPIYFENSKGEITDNQPKSCEGKEIVIGGEKFKLVKV